jgi:hypothetical protein
MQPTRNPAGPILTIIIHQHHPKTARIVLRRNTPQRLRNNIRLVARRDHRDNIGPVARYGQVHSILAL